MKKLLIFLFLNLLINSYYVKADNVADSEMIIHDPFQKPVFSHYSEKKTIPSSEKKTPWSPHLIMTLRAGKNSMANIDGHIIRLGGKIKGYKLIEVYERAVVFVKQGKITRLTLDDTEEE